MHRSIRISCQLCIAMFVAFGAGVFFGWFIGTNPHPTANATVLRESGDSYQFINPLIGFNPGEKKEFDEYLRLEKKLKSRIEAYRAEKKIQSASVYFRDVETGRWTGVNEEDLYSPASLYKVALMIAVLKKAESDAAFLEERLPFKGTRYTQSPDHEPLVAGQTYSVRELLTRLITLSDNDAKDLLRGYINTNSISDVFSDLGLTEPDPKETGDTMSARAYSRFFRTLYNATYLNRSLSEYALELLSKAEFRSGIINGLPAEARKLPVAHKFGYRSFEKPSNVVEKELHDCGIVYYPNRPYFICIMTKGAGLENLYEVLQGLSGLVYAEVRSGNTRD